MRKLGKQCVKNRRPTIRGRYHEIKFHRSLYYVQKNKSEFEWQRKIKYFIQRNRILKAQGVESVRCAHITAHLASSPCRWKMKGGGKYLTTVLKLCLSYQRSHVEHHLGQVFKEGAALDAIRIRKDDCRAEWMDGWNSA